MKNKYKPKEVIEHDYGTAKKRIAKFRKENRCPICGDPLDENKFCAWCGRYDNTMGTIINLKGKLTCNCDLDKTYPLEYTGDKVTCLLCGAIKQLK